MYELFVWDRDNSKKEKCLKTIEFVIQSSNKKFEDERLYASIIFDKINEWNNKEQVYKFIKKC